MIKSCYLYVRLGGPKHKSEDELEFEFDTVEEASVFIKTLSRASTDYLEYRIEEV